VLLEQRRAGEREQQRRRERLPTVVARRECRIRLARYGRLPQLVLQCAEWCAVGGEAILDVFQALHGQLVAHVESELAELFLLHQRAVLALSFPRGGPHTLAA